MAAAKQPSVVVVYTAEEFKDAFHAGLRDIEIRAHLDLRGLNLTADPIAVLSEAYRGPYAIGFVSPSTRSIRVCAII